MIREILGKKLGMTSIFNEQGIVVPVTVIEAGPVTVIQVKTEASDGYNAVQLGFGTRKQQRVNKPEVGHFRKAGVAPMKVLREVRLSAEEIGEYRPGQIITLAEMGFAPNSYVDVIGVSKGKGFQGVMKRHNFKGYTGSHGAHEYRRHPGSIGSSTTPGRVLKGQKMAGRMGGERVTVQNLKVAAVRPGQNLLLIEGTVPGPEDGIVTVRVAKKKGKKQASAA